MTAAVAQISGWAARIRESRSSFPGRGPLAEVDDPRGQVVAAATKRLLGEPLGVLTQGLNPTRFDSWKPGLRRKAYRYFPSTSELVREVLHNAVGPARGHVTNELVKVMKEAAQDPPPIVEALSVVPPTFVDRVRVDEVFGLQLLAWVAARQDADLRDALGDFYESLAEELSEGFAEILQAYGLELRPPFTWQSFTSVWISLVEGTTLRTAVEGDRYDPELASVATMALIVGMTRSSGVDDRDVVGLLQQHCAGPIN